MRRPAGAGGLSPAQQEFWECHGYLVLPSFFAESEVDAINGFHERLWRERPDDVVVDNLVSGRRALMSSVSEAEQRQAHKVNDLYLNYAEIRQFSLHPRLTPILAELLPDVPVLCNTLSLDYGTEQELHADSLYMTPRTEGRLVATWVALEDGHPDAGPLVYLPGSHKIPPYRFSHGQCSEIASERPRWEEYVKRQIQRLGLGSERFLPSKGDVFIWHAQLLHGGSARGDRARTRKSLVSHYFTETDCRALGHKLRACNGAYWMDRPPQACPGLSAKPLRTRLARAARAAGFFVRRLVAGKL